MKAVHYRRFGAAEVLNVEQSESPLASPDGVVVEVRAASLNVIDSRSRRGELSPFVNKKFPKTPGVDFSGVVTAVGSEVTDLRPGDEVLGAADPFRGGALAQYVAVRRKALARKPERLSWQEAAALPLAGVSALLSLRNLGGLRTGQTVLVHGSSGGLGTFAVQLARLMGGLVTTVSGTAGVELSRELGAAEAFDYRRGEVPGEAKFDIILNYSGHLPFARARPWLGEQGRLVEPSPTIPIFIGSMMANLFRGQKHRMLTAQVETADLQILLDYIGKGQMRVVVGHVFPFSQVKEAFVVLERGGVLGKIVIDSFN